MKHKMTKALGLCVLASMIVTGTAEAQSSEALLKTLVKKGVITEAEADELRKETTGGSKEAVREWVKRISFKGDLRLRYEQKHQSWDAGGQKSRQRQRYRFRYGIYSDIGDEWQLGFRLASGGTDNALSTNQSLDDKGHNDPIAIDQIYAHYMPGYLPELDLWAGKLPSMNSTGWNFSTAAIDSDFTPEGLQVNYSHNWDNGSLGFNLGGFALNESGGTERDAYLGAAQLVLNQKLTDPLDVKASVGAYGIMHRENVVSDVGVNSNARHGEAAGNTEVGGKAPIYNMNPVMADLAFTYKTSFAPLKAYSTYIKNEGAPSATNEGWIVGGKVGNAKKRGEWQVSYEFRNLEADSLWDQLADDDFGAFGTRNNGTNGYYNGTNARGHVIQGKYGITDFLSLNLSYFATEAINSSVDKTTRRFRVDLIWSF
jgi:hypothetical protein